MQGGDLRGEPESPLPPPVPPGRTLQVCDRGGGGEETPSGFQTGKRGDSLWVLGCDQLPA